MSIVALTTLWLAASAPAAPVDEAVAPPAGVTTGDPPGRRDGPAISEPPAPATKKNTGNDEPGCEE